MEKAQNEMEEEGDGQIIRQIMLKLVCSAKKVGDH